MILVLMMTRSFLKKHFCMEMKEIKMILNYERTDYGLVRGPEWLEKEVFRAKRFKI